jgi:UMP-CMP kinase 2
MEMKSVLTLAASLHRGRFVYHKKESCEKVLAATRLCRPAWWDRDCEMFFDRVVAAPIAVRTDFTHPIIVLEGLDGVGKTTITAALAAKLNGAPVIRTPDPALEPVRAKFRVLDESVARAFYCGANYIAAPEIVAATQTGPVVVDRWWCSTCAMALSRDGHPDALPAVGDDVYRWPSDLPEMTLGVLLDVDEAIRVGRMKKRGDEIPEEAKLAANAELRRAAMTAYERSGLLTKVNAPNYMAAVNSILDLLKGKGYASQAAKYSEREVQATPPY